MHFARTFSSQPPQKHIDPKHKYDIRWYIDTYFQAHSHPIREHSGSVVESFTRDRGAAGSSLHCGPWARHIYPSLVLVQPRKTRPCLTERLLMGRKESNQTFPPITSFSFRPQHYFYWISLFFTWISHLMGELCDYFILSLIGPQGGLCTLDPRK